MTRTEGAAEAGGSALGAGTGMQGAQTWDQLPGQHRRSVCRSPVAEGTRPDAEEAGEWGAVEDSEVVECPGRSVIGKDGSGAVRRQWEGQEKKSEDRPHLDSISGSGNREMCKFIVQGRNNTQAQG